MKRCLSQVGLRRGIIGVTLCTLVLLAGCSAFKLGYRQGPALTHWWLDGYLDFDDAQSQRVKAELRRWFDWHERSQLTVYAEHLARAQAESQQPVTPEQLCRWNDSTRDLLQPAIERILPAAADVVLSLSPAQLQRLDARFVQQTQELRERLAQPDPQLRLQEATQRTLKRFEGFYGRLNEAQRAIVEDGVRQSPFDADRWMEQRQQRHRELMDTLAALARERPPAAQAQERLARLAARYDGRQPIGPREASAALAAYNCALAAKVHNSATPAQRRQLAAKLAGWEADARALAVVPTSVVGATAAELKR